MITELTKGVYWVGVVDWGLRRFHGHELSTHRGSTYDAYLIVDEKSALVDTVWGPFQDQLIANIREVIDPAKVDFVVANHAEVDHSGSLPAVMRVAPQATVVVSKRGQESIEGHFHQPWPFKAAVSDRNDVITEIFKAKAILIGSPTLNRGPLPTIAPILEGLKGLRFKNKIGATFGSYGWSGEAVKLLEEHLVACKIPVVAPGVLAKWQPTGEDLARCHQLGRQVAQVVLEN